MTKDRPPQRFFFRLLRSLGLAILIIGTSLLIGIFGYHKLEGMPLIDAYLEAAMIASGMGPSATLHTSAGKIFAGTYALYSGLALIVAVGVILGPIIHHFTHKYHVDVDSR